MVAAGCLLIGLFTGWTMMVRAVDVQPIGANGTSVGFAAINGWFHGMTGTHMGLYHVTDWLGLVPVTACMFFGGIGFCQLIKRKRLLCVDHDILLLGAYYAAVISGYLFFEMFPVNYRPVLIEGRLEASYPSSTTLLVLSVMPTLTFQAERRLRCVPAKSAIHILVFVFSLFMVLGRMLSGVHWMTDIVGAVFMSNGLYWVYKGLVELFDRC